MEALRGHGLTAAVQEALNRAGGIAPYDDALSLCGRGGRAEGLWVKEEEEALLLTVLLLISPENQWALASPELRALREIDKLPALAHEEVGIHPPPSIPAGSHYSQSPCSNRRSTTKDEAPATFCKSP